MTRLFELTRAGFVERHRTGRAGFLLHREKVSWFVIASEDAGWDIRREGLPFDESILTWMTSPETRPTFRTNRNLALVDFALYNSAQDRETEYVRLVIGRNLLVTISSSASPLVKSIPESMKDISSHGQPVVEDILYNVANEIIAAHAEYAVEVRRSVNDLALRVDNEISSVEVKEILRAKIQLDRFTRVLEEQFISLGFPPRLQWRGRSDRVRSEFANLRASLRSLETSMDNTRARLDTVHHQYQLVLQEASNRRLNVLTIVQAIFVPLTFIAGVYGMNFNFIPELEWRYGYFAVMGLMVLITAFSLRYFVRHGWFG